MLIPFLGGVIFGLAMTFAGVESFSRQWWIIYVGYVIALFMSAMR